MNFVTAHDGFTLADLVSYEQKHNDANGQGNLDGTNANRSTNCGIEGETTDPSILELRLRLKRALLSTLLLSQGVPMLLAGDERGRTQTGNNNAYCQDNATSWIDWRGADQAQFEFVAGLIQLRNAHPALRRAAWLEGSRTPIGERDIVWLASNGTEMTRAQWEDGATRCFGFKLGRDTVQEATLLVLINAGTSGVVFTLSEAPGGRWNLELDSARPDAPRTGPETAVRAAELPALCVHVMSSRAAPT